ncbi:hypothetical protein DXG01_000940 [Tephrocybe rancida]|nr:hypothetical protein DXG01_000940 [Tephrocybe rancida]
MSLTFTIVKGVDVTQSQLKECNQLFNENYGIWGPHATKTSLALEKGTVGWITQLVVRAAYRRRGIASTLLRFIRMKNTFNVLGIASTHPAAFSRSIKTVDIDFIRDNHRAILKATPVNYISGAKPFGLALDPTSPSNTVSLIMTDFYVDHTEPLQALAEFRAKPGNSEAWPLGELLQGHEFLLIVKV